MFNRAHLHEKSSRHCRLRLSVDSNRGRPRSTRQKVESTAVDCGRQKVGVESTFCRLSRLDFHRFLSTFVDFSESTAHTSLE
uniref:Uncharacterized protein n=1 Tax=Caenorhabditis tropicalis TaxID=1561998 RepID=A0A1I7U586_9PELO